MKTIKLPKFKDYVNQPVNYLQSKLDGHLAKIHMGDHLYHVYTKNDIDITEKVMRINHIGDLLANLPAQSTLLGELYCPGVHATSVPTMLNDADQRLRLAVFAAPLFQGTDMTDVGLQSIMRILTLRGFEVPDTTDIQLGQHGLTEKRKEELLQIAIKNKWEGWVLKESHMAGWYKLKPVKTLDAFVIDTYASNSNRYKSGLKAIRVGIWNKDGTVRDLGTVGNGFKLPYRLRFVTREFMDVLLDINWLETDEKDFRKHLEAAVKAGLVNRNTLLDKVCEIAYDSIAAGGKLRFPRFLRWRDDKGIINCTEDQLNENEV